MKKIYLLQILFLATLYSHGQDPLFNNAQQSLVYLNPSFAGSNGLVRKQTLVRNQGYNAPANYLTFYSGLDIYLKPLKSGMAVTYVYDNIDSGRLRTGILALTYAQHFSSSNGDLKITPSLQIGYLCKVSNRSRLQFGDFIDPRYGVFWNTNEAIPAQRKRNIDICSGLLINYKHFYFGGSVFHINQPNIGLLGDFKLPYRFSCHSSVKLLETNWFENSLFIRYERQKKFNYVQFRMNSIVASHVFLGLSYGYATNISELYSYPQMVYIIKSKNHIFGFNLGYRNNFFTLGVGYDRLFFSGSSKSIQDSWEAQLSINIRDKEHRKLLTDFEKW